MLDNNPISPIGNVHSPGIVQNPTPTISSESTAAQAVALSQAVAAMQSFAAGGVVQHPLHRSLSLPLVQARLAAGAGNLVAQNSPLNISPSMLVSYLLLSIYFVVNAQIFLASICACT